MIDKPVVLITGVSRGIGLATAQLFAANGWAVVGTVRNKGYPTELVACSVDVRITEITDPVKLEQLIEQIHEEYGRIDAVVANAGYGLMGALEGLSHDSLVDQLMVNTVAAANLARLVIPVMRQQGGGAIVAVSSVAGIVGIPGYGAYNASKFALEGLFEAVSYETERSGIRVKLVEPSSVKTDFWGPSARFGNTTKEPWTNRARTRTQGMNRGLLASTVAKKIYKATNNKSGKLHYRVGLTLLSALAKRLLPDRLFRAVLKYFL